MANSKATYTFNRALHVVDATAANGRFSFNDIVGKFPPVQLFVVEEHQLKPLRFQFTEKHSSAHAHYFEGLDPIYKIRANVFIDDLGFLNCQLQGSALFKVQVQWQVPEEKFETGIVREYVYLASDDERVTVGSNKSIDSKEKGT